MDCKGFLGIIMDMRSKTIIYILILSAFLFYPQVLAYKIEDGYDDASTRQACCGPEKPNIARTGPKRSYGVSTGTGKPKYTSYGPKTPSLAITGGEYKVPTYIGKVLEVSSNHILVTNTMDNILRYHTFLLNPKTKIFGQLQKGVTVKVLYQIGKQRKANRVLTTMTAVTINVIPAGTEEEKLQYESTKAYIK